MAGNETEKPSEAPRPSSEGLITRLTGAHLRRPVAPTPPDTKSATGQQGQPWGSAQDRPCPWTGCWTGGAQGGLQGVGHGLRLDMGGCDSRKIRQAALLRLVPFTHVTVRAPYLSRKGKGKETDTY